jgi:hypothetical protein
VLGSRHSALGRAGGGGLAAVEAVVVGLIGRNVPRRGGRGRVRRLRAWLAQPGRQRRGATMASRERACSRRIPRTTRTTGTKGRW